MESHTPKPDSASTPRLSSESSSEQSLSNEYNADFVAEIVAADAAEPEAVIDNVDELTSSVVEAITEPVVRQDKILNCLNDEDCIGALTKITLIDDRQYVGVLHGYNEERNVVSLDRGGSIESSDPWYWRIALPGGAIKRVQRMNASEIIQYMRMERDCYDNEHTNKYCVH
jgi:hypothetical protein